MADHTTKTPCFTLVANDADLLGLPTYQTSDLRAALEKGSDELKLDTLRRIVTMTLNGQPQVSWGLHVGVMEGWRDAKETLERWEEEGGTR